MRNQSGGALETLETSRLVVEHEEDEANMAVDFLFDSFPDRPWEGVVRAHAVVFGMFAEVLACPGHALLVDPVFQVACHLLLVGSMGGKVFLFSALQHRVWRELHLEPAPSSLEGRSPGFGEAAHVGGERREEREVDGGEEEEMMMVIFVTG